MDDVTRASGPTRWQTSALEALQESAEAFLVSLFEGMSSKTMTTIIAC